MAQEMTEEMRELRQRIAEHYPEEDKLVFGEGPVPCAIMVAGEAPGIDEVIQKRPFAGRAGKYFEDFLAPLGLTRDEIYMTNVCKYRPRKVSIKGSVSNRTPSRLEIKDALPLFREEIELVQPKLIITLGNTPLHAATGDWHLKVGETHGTVVRGDLTSENPSIFALYHPASIIYTPDLLPTYEDDIQALRVYVDEALGRA